MSEKEEKSTIEKILNDVKNNTPQKERDPIYFIIGALLLIIGLFIFSRKITVTSGFFGLNLWGFSMGFGLVVLPLIFGIIWMFYNPKSLWAKIISIIGGILIVVGIIMNTGIHLNYMTLYDYIIILGLIAAGIGLLFRYYFKKK